MRMLRWQCGLTRKDKVRNEHVRGTLKIAPASNKVKESRLRWYGHIKRREEDQPIRKMMEMGLPGGGSRTGVGRAEEQGQGRSGVRAGLRPQARVLTGTGGFRGPQGGSRGLRTGPPPARSSRGTGGAGLQTRQAVPGDGRASCPPGVPQGTGGPFPPTGVPGMAGLLPPGVQGTAGLRLPGVPGTGRASEAAGVPGIRGGPRVRPQANVEARHPAEALGPGFPGTGGAEARRPPRPGGLPGRAGRGPPGPPEPGRQRPGNPGRLEGAGRGPPGVPDGKERPLQSHGVGGAEARQAFRGRAGLRTRQGVPGTGRPPPAQASRGRRASPARASGEPGGGPPPARRPGDRRASARQAVRGPPSPRQASRGRQGLTAPPGVPGNRRVLRPPGVPGTAGLARQASRGEAGLARQGVPVLGGPPQQASRGGRASAGPGVPGRAGPGPPARPGVPRFFTPGDRRASARPGVPDGGPPSARRPDGRASARRSPGTGGPPPATRPGRGRGPPPARRPGRARPRPPASRGHLIT
ncbi:collagen alpha-1(III) chain-like [Macrobrachium nipponense]|uniref:collagen alpha-1(III) chain-like n=1 Tax=Macrobrachium nipponense TaxID=159736 RepID=UPI0030C8CDF1